MKLQDYIGFYLGCKVRTDNGKIWDLTGISGKTATLTKASKTNNTKYMKNANISSLKLVLRSVFDITEKEKTEYMNIAMEFKDIGVPDLKVDAEQILYLTKNRFDVFGLVGAKLAVYEKKSVKA